MKEKYESPEMEMILIDIEDIILTSGGGCERQEDPELTNDGDLD